MPYHKDFNELEIRGEFQLEPDGWVPITVEYGYGTIISAQYIFWRVKGTQHTFKLPVSEFNYKSNGDPEDYIRRFLEKFREEMLGWTFQGIKADWVKEYTIEYNNYVKL